MLFDERIQPVVVEADGIEHPRGGFHGARRRIADPRQRRDGLGDDSAEFLERNERLHLPRVAKRPGGHQDRVGQLQAV
jgi:hypothetical protein